jgi:hypothetical protein
MALGAGREPGDVERRSRLSPFAGARQAQLRLDGLSVGPIAATRSLVRIPSLRERMLPTMATAAMLLGILAAVYLAAGLAGWLS